MIGMSDNLLLDTCALIWLSSGGGELSQNALNSIENAKNVFVSSISAFEISFKYKIGGIELPCDPERWYSEVLENHDLIEIPINGQIAIVSTKLLDIHKDPCDRFIIATAQLNSLLIVTADTQFEKYGIHILG